MGQRAQHPVALVTGVSRRGGIGSAIARRLAADGFNLVVHHWVPHDERQPWGADSISELLVELRAELQPGRRLIDISANFELPESPKQVVDAGIAEFGFVDVLVANHGMSGNDASLLGVTAADLDKHYAVNTRSSILLAAEVVRSHDSLFPGRIVFVTSGQDLGPMPGEIAYAASKAALSGITKTIAYEATPFMFTVNAVNPGPVDSDSYVTSEIREQCDHMFPFGRWGEPDDAARLIAWLVSKEAQWVTGQVINSEGGFTR